MVHFDSTKQFEKYVFDAPHLIYSDEDDARIYYVGFSRAREKLFIDIPTISNDISRKISDIGLSVEIL